MFAERRCRRHRPRVAVGHRSRDDAHVVDAARALVPQAQCGLRRHSGVLGSCVEAHHLGAAPRSVSNFMLSAMASTTVTMSNPPAPSSSIRRIGSPPWPDEWTVQQVQPVRTRSEEAVGRQLESVQISTSLGDRPRSGGAVEYDGHRRGGGRLRGDRRVGDAVRHRAGDDAEHRPQQVVKLRGARADLDGRSCSRMGAGSLTPGRATTGRGKHRRGRRRSPPESATQARCVRRACV